MPLSFWNLSLSFRFLLKDKIRLITKVLASWENIPDRESTKNMRVVRFEW